MTQSRNDRLKAPPFSREQISHFSKALVDQYMKRVGEDRFLENGMCFPELFEEVIYPDYEIELIEGADLGRDCNGKKLLGMFDVEANTVFIDQSIGPESGDPRRTFTLHHEIIGHAVLHGPWLRAEFERLKQRPFLATTQDSIDEMTTDRLERQANLIAGQTSAPTRLVKYALMRKFMLTKKLAFFGGPCGYWLEVDGASRRFNVDDFSDLCRIIARLIQDRFDGLSIQSLSYRVAECSLIDDRSRSGVRLYRAAV